MLHYYSDPLKLKLVQRAAIYAHNRPPGTYIYMNTLTKDSPPKDPHQTLTYLVKLKIVIVQSISLLPQD